MPQMMPMYWILMMISTILLLMIIMNFIYFLTILPMPTNMKFNSIKIYNWTWKW